MRISIGADHRGYELKKFIINHFKEYEWIDVGTHSIDRTDYPLYAQNVCREILQGNAVLGIAICGTGVGVSIAANRFKGIYAALCWNPQIAKHSREYDGSNVLALPSNFINNADAVEIISAWLNAEFKGGTYLKRLEMMD
jgi:ribose 5-phosphate isomerase B